MLEDLPFVKQLGCHNRKGIGINALDRLGPVNRNGGGNILLCRWVIVAVPGAAWD